MAPTQVCVQMPSRYVQIQPLRVRLDESGVFGIAAPGRYWTLDAVDWTVDSQTVNRNSYYCVTSQSTLYFTVDTSVHHAYLHFDPVTFGIRAMY